MVAVAHEPGWSSASRWPRDEPPLDIDQRVIFRGMTWKDFEVMLAVRGDRAGVRIYYLGGEIELMSSSLSHEAIKKTIARLVEAYADDRGLECNGYGSWTLRDPTLERGAEPDECYVVGATFKERPDLAIEVVWTGGGLDRFAIYRGLGVRELWVWTKTAAIEVHVLRGDAYEQITQSELFPDLDLALLASFLSMPSQSQAVRAYRAALGARR